MRKSADQMKVGEEYEPLVLQVSSELNEQFMRALDSFNLKYKEIVHLGLLLNFCSITQSPSFYLEENVAAVGAKFDAKYKHQIKLGKTVTISWKISEVYERRNRRYQISDVLVKDDEGVEILQRRVNNTFIGGEYLERRVKWEKETGYRRAVAISEFPKEEYEIVGKRKELTMEKLRYFSGGLPGPNWPARNIHTDREISIRSGMGRPVASGMMFEYYLIDLMINFFGENWFEHGETKVIVIDTAGDGDTISPKSVIKSKEFDGSKEKITLDIWCENQYGNKIMVGSATGLWLRGL